MKAVLVAGALLVATTTGCGRTTTPVPLAKDTTVPGIGVTASRPDPTWPPGPSSVAHKLGDDARGSVLLVEDQGAIVARTASGSVVRNLFTGKVSRTSYDPRVAIVWFLHDGRLRAIDLGDTTDTSTAIVDDMPDIPFDASRGTDTAHPTCDACVTVSAVPPAVGVTVEARPGSGGDLQGDEWRRFERDSKIAASARPRISADATRILDRLGRRKERSWHVRQLDLQTWQIPQSASSRGPCSGGCTRAFSLEQLGRQLVLTGRECDCNDDRCWSTCVLFDPSAKRFASPSQPADFRTDAKPENACHPTLDSTGNAYILDDHRVCTATGCVTLSGRILGWVEPGMTTQTVQEDLSICPE